MLIPVASERLPVRVEMSILSARGLPVMNKSINSCDAFVEVRFAEFLEKTEVVTSLNPFWNSEMYQIDSDERQLSEELFEFRVMDHDTYSTNDAIGRSLLDCNQIIERMRMRGDNKTLEDVALPIYDTINGNRGELTIRIKLHTLIDYNPAHYVQICSGSRAPAGHIVEEVYGLLTELKTAMDPDYEWIDKIRSPRATNEARMSTIREMMRSAAISIAHKAEKHQCNLILGYIENVDVEGSCSDLLVVRVFGTAVRTISNGSEVPANDVPFYPILSVDHPLRGRRIGTGAVVAARTVKIFEQMEEPDVVRRSWWSELRVEIYQQAVSLKCNAIIGYTETMTIHDGIALLGVSGTAIVLKKTTPDHSNGQKFSTTTSPCEQYHTTYIEERLKVGSKRQKCSICKKFDVLSTHVSTAHVPPNTDFIGPKHFIQVSVSKRISSDPDDAEDYAQEVSNALPFADNELFDNLLGEMKLINPHTNAIFDLRFTYSISDDLLVAVGTGIILRLNALSFQVAASPALANVLSFSSLQKAADARRFSWGTMKDAIRFKTVTPHSVTLKVISLKVNSVESVDESNRSRNRLNTLVNKFKKRQLEKDFINRVLFERQISLSLGFHENCTAANTSIIAGVHLGQILLSMLLTREVAENYPVLFRYSDVIVREDLSTSVKDPATVDNFVCHALEEHLMHVRTAASLQSGQLVVSNLTLSCPQFTVSKEHAHVILVISCDVHLVDF